VGEGERGGLREVPLATGEGFRVRGIIENGAYYEK